jgi:hypothetical protein
MNTDSVDTFNLEASTLELVDKPTKRSGSICAGENIFIHKETPDEILELPGLPQPSNLEEEHPVIIKYIMYLSQERGEVTDTNMLSHFETCDLMIAPIRNGNVAIVHAQNSALLLTDASLSKPVVTPCGLVTTKSDTRSLSTIVDTRELGQGTPPTANIQKALTFLQANLLAYDGKLIVLELFKSLLFVDIGDNARRVDHAGAKEPAVEIIATIIVITNLLLV